MAVSNIFFKWENGLYVYFIGVPVKVTIPINKRLEEVLCLLLRNPRQGDSGSVMEIANSVDTLRAETQREEQI